MASIILWNGNVLLLYVSLKTAALCNDRTMNKYIMATRVEKEKVHPIDSQIYPGRTWKVPCDF